MSFNLPICLHHGEWGSASGLPPRIPSWCRRCQMKEMQNISRGDDGGEEGGHGTSFGGVSHLHELWALHGNELPDGDSWDVINTNVCFCLITSRYEEWDIFKRMGGKLNVFFCCTWQVYVEGFHIIVKPVRRKLPAGLKRHVIPASVVMTHAELCYMLTRNFV